MEIYNNASYNVVTRPFSHSFSVVLVAGYYLYIETSTGLIGNKAILISPQFQQAYSTCQLKFSYHMYGSTIGSLTVYLNDGASRTRMWTLRGLYILISFHLKVVPSLGGPT